MKEIFYKDVSVPTALVLHKAIDNWFPVRYSLNPYSGCEYGCWYCRTNWKKSKTIISKKNLPELLEQELKKITHPQIIGIGGGYNDVFGPINRNKKISNQSIKKILQAGHKPLIMTKNPSYAIEIMKPWLSYPKNQRPIIITSISSPYDHGLEEKAPSVQERFSALKTLSSNFVVGVALLPWLDTSKEKLGELLGYGKKAGWSFTVMSFLQGTPPKFINNSNNQIMDLSKKKTMEKAHYQFSKEWKLWSRLPYQHFKGYLSPKDEITVLLAYQYYLSKYENQSKSAFRLASYFINQTSEKEFQKLYNNRQWEVIPGVGKFISQTITETLYHKKIDFFSNTWKKIGFPVSSS